MVSAYIKCDNCGTKEDSVYLHTNRIRQEAMRKGWKCSLGFDRCPKCLVKFSASAALEKEGV